MKKLAQLLGIDIGTSAVKAVVIDVDGSVIAQAAYAHDLHSLNAGWAEEDPQDWWQNTIRAIDDCLSHPSVSPKAVKGVGVTGMVPAIVLLGKNGDPLRYSIQQNDARTGGEISEFNQRIDPDRFFAITGSSLSQQSVGPKLVWLMRHEPEVWSQVWRVMGSYDYINFCLTGAESLESNWALESGLYDINQGDWSDELLAIFDLQRGLFPPVRNPSEVIGTIGSKASGLTELIIGTSVVAGSADHVAAALAAGLKDDGDLLLKFGSAGDILYSTCQAVLDQRLFIDYHDIPGKFLLNGCMATSGSLLRWFVNQFCQVDVAEADAAGMDEFEYLNFKAEKIPAGCEGVIVLPYFLGEKTPIFDPHARGIFYGMTLYHTRDHLYRAVMEAVVFGFKHHVMVLEEKGLKINRVIVSEGGAKSRLWRQIAADVLNRPVIYLRENPGAALAAAFIAGMGADVFNAWDEIEKFITVESITEPLAENQAVYEKNFRTYLALYENLKATFRS